MPVSIGPKIGIDGEAQYRAAINNIIQQGKTLQTQMEAIGKGFVEAGDGATEFERKSANLNSQIENQKKLIESLKDAVAKSTEKTGENSTETLKWQQQLNKAQGELAGMESELKDLGNEEDKTAKKTSTFGEVLKANLTSEAIIGGIKAMASAVAAVGKATVSFVSNAVTAFGELEQNIGGSEAVFGEYGATIQKTAESAYKTMGTTQSEYLATANKMGALFQGSGLTAQRSMDLTAQAMQRAADMASVMGIDTQAALDAVTGAAKGNYTMMDNLGVAMNATTLEAYRVSQGMDKAFSKMTNAEKAELAMKYFFENTTQYAGNFEREASETISGSIGMLTAAVQTWVAGLGNSEADIIALTQNIVDAFGSVVDNIVPVIQNVVAALPQVFEAVLPAINSLLPMILNVGAEIIMMLVSGIESAFPSLLATAKPLISVFVKGVVGLAGMVLKSGAEILGALISGIVDCLPDLIDTAVEVVFSFVDKITEPGMLENVVNTGLQILEKLITGLTNAIPKLVQFVPKIIQNITTTLTKNLPQIIQMGINTLTSLIQGITNALPELVKMLPTIITTFVSTLVSNLPLIIETGVKILASLIEGIFNSLGNLASAAWQIVTTILGELADLPSYVVSIGRDLVSGIWNGISNGTTWIKNKIKDWVGNVTNFLKKLFGIHSPSTVMRDQVGKYLALGIGEGFENEMRYVAKNMGESIPVSFGWGGGRTTNLGGVTFNIQGADGQDVEELANIVMYKMQRVVDSREAVFA